MRGAIMPIHILEVFQRHQRLAPLKTISLQTYLERIFNDFK